MNFLQSIVKWIQGAFTHIFSYGDVMFGKYSNLIMIALLFVAASKIFKIKLNLKRG